MSEYKYKLPDVGEGVVEAEIVEWHIQSGDSVSEDQHILDVMTDKATVEIPCAVNGIVKSLVGNPGDVIAVGTEILVIEIDGTPTSDKDGTSAKTESKTEPVNASPDALEPKSTQLDSTKISKPALTQSTRSTGERPLAGPAVRKRALDADINLETVPGTGPAGRITHQDIDDFISVGGRLISKTGPTGSNRTARTGVHEKKIIGLRRKIAENMALSKRTIPHITYVDEIDLTALEDLRAHMNANRANSQAKLTIIPFLILAMTKTLPSFPHANAHYDTDSGILTQYDGIHCGIAAATPKGLMVPVIKHAESLDIWSLASETRRLAEAAKTGKASKDELTGSSITITSLGAIGGIVTTPVINHPETAIIGVNKLQTLPRYDSAGHVVPKKIMSLSSSFDHRIVDGHDAAQLIQAMKTLLENPATLFMG